MSEPDDFIVETSGGMIDFSKLITVAKEGGVISPPLIARAFKYKLPEAETVLSDLADKSYLDLLPESGVVPLYRVSKNAYAKVEANRSKTGVLASLFSGDR